jgi:hypothetical protein
VTDSDDADWDDEEQEEDEEPPFEATSRPKGKPRK